MKNKRKNNQNRTIPLDVITHGIMWFFISIIFFLLNYFTQSAVGFTISDPQIYQFIFITIIWAIGLSVHGYLSNKLAKRQQSISSKRSLRHIFREIHIGIFVGFFTMLIAIGFGASMAGTGDLNVLEVLKILLGWGVAVSAHSWMVSYIDRRNADVLANEAVDDIDISRLTDDAPDRYYNNTTETTQAQQSL